MSVSRRQVLYVIGSSVVIAAAGATAFSMTRTPGAALRPWSAAGTGYADPRMRALSYAILAPNPHNRQPWLVDLSQESKITLFCDADRRLPETDPFDRQISIGLGCFLELLSMAAASDGYASDVTLFPNGTSEERLDERPVAEITLRRDPLAKAPELFRYVHDRRTNRSLYDTSRPIAPDVLGQLQNASFSGLTIGTTNTEDGLKQLRALTWTGHEIEMLTESTRMESVRLMRIGKSEIQTNPDGIYLGGAMLEALNLVGMLTRETIGDPQSDAFKQGMDMFRGLLNSAMGYVWVVTDSNSRADQIATGRAWLGINLRATALRLALQPLSQTLQEYPEMAFARVEIHKALGAGPGQTVQMLGRLGYADQVPPSPRWGLETRVASS